MSQERGKRLRMEHVNEILDVSDIHLRSYLCTQAYQDLSQMMRKVILFPRPAGALAARCTDDDLLEDANFWTFLTWSASSVTMNIRSARARLGGRQPSASARARRLLSPLAMQALAEGEEFAFSDCARIGVTFYDKMRKKNMPSGEQVVTDCLAALDDQLRSIRDHNDIREGVEALYEAAKYSKEHYRTFQGQTDETMLQEYRSFLKKRSELMLKASLYLDAAEQKLVQHALMEAFYSVPNRLLGIDDVRGMRGRRRFSRLTIRRVAPLLQDVSARLTTRWVFSLVLPNEVVELGKDLPLHASGRRFHPRLNTIADPELLRLVQRFDNSYLNGTGTAARDWTDYADRMRFIVNYLRLYQLRIDPNDAPYETFQADRIRAFSYPWLEPGEEAGLLKKIQDDLDRLVT